MKVQGMAAAGRSSAISRSIVWVPPPLLPVTPMRAGVHLRQPGQDVQGAHAVPGEVAGDGAPGEEALQAAVGVLVGAGRHLRLLGPGDGVLEALALAPGVDGQHHQPVQGQVEADPLVLRVVLGRLVVAAEEEHRRAPPAVPETRGRAGRRRAPRDGNRRPAG